MILCIDIKDLKQSQDIQKDIDLSGLLTHHTKYYYSEEEARKDNYVPLNFCISVRSVYTNLVLQIDKGEEKRYYNNLKCSQPTIHSGYDLIMYLASIAVMDNIENKSEFDDFMCRHSQFTPIGFYNPEPTLVDPIVYSHIIISDDGVKEFPRFLKSDRRMVSIDEMKNNCEGNIKPLLDSIFNLNTQGGK